MVLCGQRRRGVPIWGVRQLPSQIEEEDPAKELEKEGCEVGGKTGQCGVQKPKEGRVLRGRKYAVGCAE